MASEKHDPSVTVKMVETTLEKAHTASEGHFGHAASDAHQAQPGPITAQALGGFPKVASAISDPNATAPVQSAANDSKPAADTPKN